MAYIYETADAAQNTTTTYNINVGDFFIGTTSTVSGVANSDWIRFQGAANTTYTVSLSSLGLFAAAIDDPVLQGYNGAGIQLFSNDDGGPKLNAQLTFTTTAAGSYYIEAKGFGSNNSGQYIATVTLGARASFDHMMGGSALYGAELSWSPNSAGTAVNVTYAIRASGDAFDSNGDATTLQLLTTAQTLAAQQAAATYSELCGITLTQVGAGGTSNNATVLFGAYSSMADPAGAYASLPGSTRADNPAGDVWLNNSQVDGADLQFGTYSYYVMIHELGHAVGLSHPGEYNAGVGGPITYASNALFTQDSHQYTIMSYFSETETGANFGGGYADTPMLYDVYALHQLYGADYTTRAGNTVYGFNSNAGAVYNFLINTDPAICIWDGAGTDSIDVSGWTMAQTINLNEGTFSSVGGLVSNLSIAFGALIENAIGGLSADTITGNNARNVIEGGLGVDYVYGGSGDDTLYGNTSTGAGVFVAGTVTGDSGDFIFGNDGADTIYGNQGNDRCEGGLGVDYVYGGYGDDTLYGNTSTGAGVFVVGTVNGDSGDFIFGNDGADTIYGNQGNDRCEGGLGVDYVYGGYGDDTLYGNTSTGAGVFVAGTVTGDSGDFIFGNDGADTIYGNQGNDSLDGGSGTDVLYGGWGDDYIVGGTEADTIYGNDGYDRAYFSGNISNYTAVNLTAGSWVVTENATGYADSLFGIEELNFDNGSFFV